MIAILRLEGPIFIFLLLVVYESIVVAWRLESEEMMKRLRSRWPVHHRVWRAILAFVLFDLVLFEHGGADAAICGLAGASIARLWIETFNYYQHYGQVRLSSMPVGRRHVWNHLRSMSRVVAFKITNHASAEVRELARAQNSRAAWLRLV